MEQMQEFENEARNDLIEGRNAVMEALRAGRTIDKIFIAKGDVDKTLGHIASKARSAGIVVTEARSEERRVGKECRSRWSPYH